MNNSIPSTGNINSEFTIINWNVGGAKFLELNPKERKKFKQELGKKLSQIIRDNNFPDIITLQEVVGYQKPDDTELEQLITPPKGYVYYSFKLIDTDRLSSKSKWNKIFESKDKEPNWPIGTYFFQGNAFLFKESFKHYPVWDLTKNSTEDNRNGNRDYIERVNLESGLYFGERGSEPRAALVAHFIVNPKGPNGKPLDIFVVNVHLTTLMMEREGIPEVDSEARNIRLNQLEVIFNGIISRYNKWRWQGYLERGAKREMQEHETNKRYEPLWIIAGDFNFTPESKEYRMIQDMNFLDLVQNKLIPTKAKGAGNNPSLTVDYIFGGPKFLALNPFITEAETKANRVDITARISDHFPLIAKVPIQIPD